MQQQCQRPSEEEEEERKKGSYHSVSRRSWTSVSRLLLPDCVAPHHALLYREEGEHRQLWWHLINSTNNTGCKAVCTLASYPAVSLHFYPDGKQGAFLWERQAWVRGYMHTHQSAAILQAGWREEEEEE